MGRKLFVFDFDNTLVNGNADTWVGGTLSSGAMEAVKAEMSNWYHDWREFINKLLLQLHREGASHDDILVHMKKLRIHGEGLKALEAVRAAPDADAIIISDANSIFIDAILQECGMADVFTTVLTNPASFNEKGLMSVAWHHTHTCQLCAATPNMCKGTILKEYLKNSAHFYTQVVYTGDGRNDLCPLLQLGPNDVGVVRKGYSLEKALAKGSYDIKASVQIVDFLQELGSVIVSQC